MKITRLHMVILVFLCFLNTLDGFSFSNTQYPELTRQFDDDFKTRYSSNRFNYEGDSYKSHTPSSSGTYEDYKNEQKSSYNFNINLDFLSWFFYLALALAVLILVYILLNEGRSSLFSTKPNKALQHREKITAENIENTDISALIRQAENDNNFRLAIRYYYLLLLKTLSLKKHIKFEDDKTNAAYVNETKVKPFGPSFAYTSYLYNYIWYGEFPVNTEQYNKAKQRFISLLNLLK